MKYRNIKKASILYRNVPLQGPYECFDKGIKFSVCNHYICHLLLTSTGFHPIHSVSATLTEVRTVAVATNWGDVVFSDSRISPGGKFTVQVIDTGVSVKPPGLSCKIHYSLQPKIAEIDTNSLFTNSYCSLLQE